MPTHIDRSAHGGQLLPSLKQRDIPPLSASPTKPYSPMVGWVGSTAAARNFD